MRKREPPQTFSNQSAETTVLREMGIGNFGAAKFFRVGDVLVSPKDIQKVLSRFANRLVNYNDDDVYQFSHFGTATGIKYRGRCFLIVTDHQRQLCDEGNLAIVDHCGQKAVSPSHGGFINITEDAERDDYNDFCVFEFNPSDYAVEYLSSQFFPVEDKTGISNEESIEIWNVGYPTSHQEVDYFDSRVHLKSFINCLELLRPTETEHVYEFKTLSEDRFFEDGMSGSPVFQGHYRRDDGCQVRWIGIVVRGGDQSRFGRVIDAKYIFRIIDDIYFK